MWQITMYFTDYIEKTQVDCDKNTNMYVHVIKLYMTEKLLKSGLSRLKQDRIILSVISCSI